MLYVAESLDAPPRLLVDPNLLAKDGTVVLADWVPSEDGKFVAISIASAGSDWHDVKVLNADTGEQLRDVVHWVKFSIISWTKDNQGFFYSRFDEPKTGQELTETNYFQKLYYHRIGDEQAKDQLIYERKDFKDWGFQGDVSEDGRFLIISVLRGTENNSQVFYKDLEAPASAVVELIAGFDAEYNFVGNDGDVFYVTTDLDAPMRRVIAIDVREPDRKKWRELIPEAKEVLGDAEIVNDRFIASYLKDAQTVVKLYNMQGQFAREVSLPSIGSARGFEGRSDDPETFFDFSNFTTPSVIFRYDVSTGETAIFRGPKLKFHPERYETTQVFYESKDGTRVPMFITHRKGLKPNRETPTLLYGYGGFDISMTPTFSVMNLVWLEMGEVYALPNLRGGGEYGRAWHESGMLDKKQNVFDDFISAAQWLIDHHYTSPEKLAILGRSNGGLLVGASMTQRPDLFGAAIPAVGVMDMLRFHKFTIGWAWVNEYGSSDDPQQLSNLLKYSPLHNLKPGVRYPSTMVTTADHDDRVVPGHSFKFAAALQQAHQGANPALIRIETSAGHGAGTPTTKLIQTAADMLAFLVKELHVKDVQLGSSED